MSDFQKTIKKEGSLIGPGLHTGLMHTVIFKPAGEDEGIRIFKHGKPVPMVRESSIRCTALGSKEDPVMTVEHVLAALSGLGITNIVIDVIGSEMPAMDGSSLPFVNFLKSLELVEQKKKKKVFSLKEPIFIGEKTKALVAFPSEDFRVSYVLDYPMSSLSGQSVDFAVTEEIFEKQIAPARTFCTDEEAHVLRDQGFGLGATPENTLLMSPKGPIGAVLRFSDECARHKALDMIGDLTLTGLSLKARFIGIRSGHALNSLMVDKILRLAEVA